ncbi:hypothetical protein SACS_1060 [Parasaccharibacter apium]|uniref:Uncharacterized protein n=1 Tax=Parasaccharibacter apium TaxID=1510841 RepID=A0A7U7G638_9PROT|nr:hypothetical protein SACS_1060 [Parasaccharibacter apium]
MTDSSVLKKFLFCHMKHSSLSRQEDRPILLIKIVSLP